MLKKFCYLFMLLGIVSCGKSEDEQLQEDIKIIEQYLTDNNLTAQRTASGLHYIITQEGSGVFPAATATVEVKYKGYFTDNRVFDETTGNQTIEFRLNRVIKGWTEGLQLFKKGGKGTLLIPSKLGYANNPPSGIPSNAVLLFDIELVDIK
jgi:FKBP-type peptidyl-prolyl cis-trans isomerase FkpA